MCDNLVFEIEQYFLSDTVFGQHSFLSIVLFGVEPRMVVTLL